MNFIFWWFKLIFKENLSSPIKKRKFTRVEMTIKNEEFSLVSNIHHFLVYLNRKRYSNHVENFSLNKQTHYWLNRFRLFLNIFVFSSFHPSKQLFIHSDVNFHVEIQGKSNSIIVIVASNHMTIDTIRKRCGWHSSFKQVAFFHSETDVTMIIFSRTCRTFSWKFRETW